MTSEVDPAAIRAYRPSDHDRITALWRAVFPDAPARNDPELDIQRKAGVQPELFLVACVETEIAGTCMAGFDGHRGWVHLVAVAPRFRRRGIGAALMSRAEALLAERGCPKLNLQVRASAELRAEPPGAGHPQPQPERANCLVDGTVFRQLLRNIV
jgi:ribosomal protein S18 acetylase RimI-like enzyme